MLGAIPVGEQLAKRGVGLEITCKRCGQPKSVDHALLLCNFAQKVWELAPIQIGQFKRPPTLQAFLSEAKHF